MLISYNTRPLFVCLFLETFFSQTEEMISQEDSISSNWKLRLPLGYLGLLTGEEAKNIGNLSGMNYIIMASCHTIEARISVDGISVKS